MEGSGGDAARSSVSWVPDIVDAAGPPAGFYDLLDSTVERAAPALHGTMPVGGGGAGAKVPATRAADIVGSGDFARVVDAMVEQVLAEGVRPEFKRFFVDAQHAQRLGRPELNGSHMPCRPSHAQDGHRCTKECLLRLMYFQSEWLAHHAPIAERLARARNEKSFAAQDARGRGTRTGVLRGAANDEGMRDVARMRNLDGRLDARAPQAAAGPVPATALDLDADSEFGADFVPHHDGEYLTHTWRAAIESTEAFAGAAAVELLGTGFVPGGAVCRWCVQEVLCVSDSYLYGGVQPRIQSWVAAAGGTSMDSVPIVAAEDIQRLDVTTGKPCMLCVGQRFGGTCRHPRIR